MESGPSTGHESGPTGRLLGVVQLLPRTLRRARDLRFKAERDESRRELGQISKKACIVELEWEDQRKQLLETIDGISLDFDPIQLLKLTAIALQLCSPRRRA
jgi:hypothetical protein